ncbi:hypothetical protein [Oligoflexus tunisiensis]|uniref:hypothetical protein n=1 Tax=Oligoflexus tunisiensis TaxID=708132 RepID=UPI00114CC2EF|nr:hypothetical protein [Oligoflexus tunisiensis]
MALPQIDAATCAVLVTLSLWMWTRLKLPDGCHHQEAILRRQNIYAYWAFGLLVGLEVLAEALPSRAWQLAVGPLSGLIFYFFAVASYQSETGFWSKRRNQALGLTMALAFSVGTGFMLAETAFVPVFAALAISHLCHKKYVQTVFASIKDIETLQAKLLKQEAAYANLRHFESLSVRQTSQQA